MHNGGAAGSMPQFGSMGQQHAMHPHMMQGSPMLGGFSGTAPPMGPGGYPVPVFGGSALPGGGTSVPGGSTARALGRFVMSAGSAPFNPFGMGAQGQALPPASSGAATPSGTVGVGSPLRAPHQSFGGSN